MAITYNESMEYKKSIQYIQVGLFSFFVLLLICVIIRPEGLGANNGISYYGTYANTIVPYSLAFLVESVVMWRASSIMGKNTKFDRNISYALKVFAILFIGILITPHTVLGWEHKIIGTTLFGIQFVMCIAFVLYILSDFLNVILLALLFISGLLSLMYLIVPMGFMIQAQVIFQISVWLIFIRSFIYSHSRLED